MKYALAALIALALFANAEAKTGPGKGKCAHNPPPVTTPSKTSKINPARPHEHGGTCVWDDLLGCISG